MIVGDSNMSEYAPVPEDRDQASILLAMLEDSSTVLRDLTLENPIRAIREISHDITCQRRVRLANGAARCGPWRHSDWSTSRAGLEVPGPMGTVASRE